MLMESFIESINPTYCFVMAGIALVLCAVSAVYFVKSKNKMLLIVLAICFGLFYDMFVTGLGEVIETSDAFYGISIVRHLCHSLITPLLFIYTLQVFRDCGKLLHKRYTFITIGIVVFLAASGVISIFTSPHYIKTTGGVVQLSMDKANTYLYAAIILNFMSFGTLIPMIACSIVALIYKKDYNILIATVLMTLLSGVGAALFSTTMFAVTYIGELGIGYFFFKYIYDQKIKFVSPLPSP